MSTVVNLQKKMLDVIRCPWPMTKMSPRHKTMKALCSYMYNRVSVDDSLLEFGCGVSTWYLTQLKFKNYVACEEFSPAIENVKNGCKGVEIVSKWVDIPKRKYSWEIHEVESFGVCL
jgi:hypothetical protein